MIYIAAALFCEAKPFIEHFGMKSDSRISHFRFFSGEKACLVVTGTGKLRAAVAVTEMLTICSPAEGDSFINAGIAAFPKVSDANASEESSEKLHEPITATKLNISRGEGFLCHSIEDADTGKVMYPDMLRTNGFKEAALMTVSVPFVSKRTPLSMSNCTETLENGASILLVDMEASGAYSAASHFFAQHRMFFFKVVSDFGEGERLVPDDISELLRGYVGDLEKLAAEGTDALNAEIEAREKDLEALTERYGEKLSLSVTMAFSLHQIVHYGITKGLDMEAVLSDHLSILERTISEKGMLKKDVRNRLFAEFRACVTGTGEVQYV